MNRFDVFRQKNAVYRNLRRHFLDEVVKTHFTPFEKDINDKTILEIGCGSGLGTEIILKYFAPKILIATDLDPALLEKAKLAVKNRLVHFDQADCTNLNYDDQFAAIFEFGTLHHLTNWQDCLTELHRVLRLGGKVFLLDISINSFDKFGAWAIFSKLFSLHPYAKMYTKKELVTFLKRLGFKIISEAAYNNPQKSFVIVLAKNH